MNELALKDIHLPDSSLWWPPAPGWWLLLLSMVLLALLLPRIIRRLRHKPLNRLCLQELDTIRQRLGAGQSKDAALRDTAALLRRTLIAYRGRDGFAASTGNDWVHQLQALTAGDRFSRAQLELLAHRRYQRDSDCDIDGLLQACEHWLRALPRGVAHVSD